MKAYIGILSVLVIAVCVHCDLSDEKKEMIKECQSEVGITEEKHGPPNFNDPKEKCFHACIMEKSGKMVDGKIVIDKAIECHMKHNPDADDSAKEKITECVDKANQQTDVCEVAGSMGKCLFEKLGPPKHKHH